LGEKGSDPFSTDFAVLGTGLAPGTIVGVGERLLVQAGDQPLSITEVQLEGRRPQSAREFINGSRPLVGDLFEPLSLS
jgi:methionyl-tRNA formyltransferase